MDSDLQQNLDTEAASHETSRCIRCVKDKKGCDRRFPCSRCTESGQPDQCQYSGSIRPRLREKRNERPSRKQKEPTPVFESEQDRTEAELNRQRILRGYTDIVTHLPIDIYRSTRFIRSLDSSYTMATKELDDLCRELQQCTDISQSLVLRSKICKLMRQSKEDRAETIAELGKLQNMVESQISVLSTEIDKIENPQTMKVLDERESSPQKGGDDGFDIPIEDDEPTYCYCGRVSFGKMIACENEACEGGEWFHFDCLNIKSAPKGKWFCDVCRGK